MPNRHRTSEELEFNAAVGRNIKFLRKKRNLNQSKVGQAIGTTFQQIQKYEKGSNGVSSNKLKLLANKFNVSMDVLADPMMIAKYEGFSNEHNQS
jgi:transcriptional regulator with XRE-family HTH domain